MTEPTYTWHKLADSIGALEFNPNGLIEIDVKGTKICLVTFKDQLHACAAKCPHASGNMASGYIDALGNIVCPLHRYKFSLEKGRNTSGEGYFLRTYPLKITEEGVFVGMKENIFAKWLK